MNGGGRCWRDHSPSVQADHQSAFVAGGVRWCPRFIRRGSQMRVWTQGIHLEDRLARVRGRASWTEWVVPGESNCSL